MEVDVKSELAELLSFQGTKPALGENRQKHALKKGNMSILHKELQDIKEYWGREKLSFPVESIPIASSIPKAQP